jgi:hypothetical protein
MRPANAVKCARIVEDGSHRAVRHVFRVEDVRARHDDQTVDRQVRLAGDRIARVHDGEAIHGERVAVGAWRKGTNGGFPHAVGSLLQLSGRDTRLAHSGNVARAAEFDFLGVGREDAKRHSPVGPDFGGDDSTARCDRNRPVLRGERPQGRTADGHNSPCDQRAPQHVTHHHGALSVAPEGPRRRLDRRLYHATG